MTLRGRGRKSVRRMMGSNSCRATFLCIMVIGLVLCSSLDVVAYEAADLRIRSEMEPEMMRAQLSPLDAWLQELGFVYDETLGRVRNPFDFPRGEADPAIQECFVPPLPDISIFQDLSRSVITVVGRSGYGKSALVSWLASQPGERWIIYRNPQSFLHFVELSSDESGVIGQNVNPYYLALDIDDRGPGNPALFVRAVDVFTKCSSSLGGAVLRLFVPQELADSVKNYELYMLDWSPGLLQKLLTLRLTWASAGRITDFLRLFEGAISQERLTPHEELASIARYPRRMFEIGQHLFNFHFAISSSTCENVRLKLSTWKTVYDYYVGIADDVQFIPGISKSDITLRLTRNAGSVCVNGEVTEFPPIPAEAKSPSRISGREVKIYGEGLFKRVLQGEARKRYREIFDSKLSHSTTSFPINFHIHLPLENELLSVPWELLCDDGRFLIPEGKIEIIRHLDQRQPTPAVMGIEPPLRVLYIAPRPQDQTLFPPYDGEALDEIAKASNGALKIDRVSPPTYDELKEWILPSLADPGSDIKFHVIHYDGHGAFGFHCPKCETVNPTATCLKCEKDLSAEEPQGFLFFEERQGYSSPKSARISANHFANLLASSGIPVVFLSACNSAIGGGTYIHNGIAARLMLAGIAGVIGLQGEVSAPVMKDFVKGFYDKLVTFESSTLISALVNGRRWLSTARCKETWWHLPVLYLRDGDYEGKVFKLKSKEKK